MTDNRCYAEREPIAYFARLKDLHRALRQAFARKQLDRVAALKWEIRSFRLASHTTYGKGTP